MKNILINNRKYEDIINGVIYINKNRNKKLIMNMY